MKLLAQTAELTEVAGKAIEASSGFGGEVWLLSIVLISVGLLVAFYTWKIGIPNANAHRENSAKLADAINALVTPINETHVLTNSSETKLIRIESALRAKASCRSAECSALQKVAEKVGVDVSNELGQIQGAMAAAVQILNERAGVNDR